MASLAIGMETLPRTMQFPVLVVLAELQLTGFEIIPQILAVPTVVQQAHHPFDYSIVDTVGLDEFAIAVREQSP